MNEDVEKQLIRARTALYIDHPFYGVLSLRLQMVEDYTIPTACVDHEKILYNPDFVATLTPNLTKSLIAHEVGHVFMDHLDRCGSRHPKKWNAACDYVVNAGLHEDKLEVGKDWLLNQAWFGKHADEIYTLLPDDPDGGGKPGNGPSGDSQGWGALDDMKGSPDKDTAADNALGWQIAAINAAKIAESQGKLPATMKRLVDKLVNNAVDWTQQLRDFVTTVSDADYSWSHPQRRMLAHGLILPSLYSESMGLMVNGIDTSGSISDYILQKFGAEIIAARNAVSPERMMNIYCDAAVAHVDDYDMSQEVKFEGHGGGGTDFNPPFDYIAKQGLKPDCFIYLTDGYGPFPKEPPPYPVLWVMTTDVKPPWGQCIRINV